MTRDHHFARTLAGARAGEATAWESLYHDIAPVLIGYLRAQHLPDADDVAGEVLLEVVRGIDRFNGGAEQFRSWVLAIAHHRLIDARRRAARRPAEPTATEELDTPPARDDPEADALAAVGLGDLEPALATLTEDQRTVLLLRVIGDLSIAQVARITGRRSGAVKQLQRRATTALREALERHEPRPPAHSGAQHPQVRASSARDVTLDQLTALAPTDGPDDGR